MAKKHLETPADFDKPYEDNTIGLTGILYFGVGLFALVVVTFILMWAFLGALRDNAKENAGPVNPMGMTDKERLPPEPRLQLAPGFKVDSEHSRVNLELMEPQAEWRVLQKQWAELREKGQVDPATGTVISMPIDAAIEKYLSGTIKAKSGVDAEKVFRDSHKFISDASAGRIAGETQR